MGLFGVSVMCCSAVFKGKSFKGLQESTKEREKCDVCVRMNQLFQSPCKQNTCTTQLLKDLRIKKHFNILKRAFQMDKIARSTSHKTNKKKHVKLSEKKYLDTAFHGDENQDQLRVEKKEKKILQSWKQNNNSDYTFLLMKST